MGCIQFLETMGRQIKEGLDYHPVLVDFEENDKISLMLSECGWVGELVLQRLWRLIYKGKGYYYQFSSDECLLLSRRMGYDIKPNDINKVVESCCRRKIFDPDMFDKYQILTSRRIQENYLIATIERTIVRLDFRFLVINLPKRANIQVVNPDLSNDIRTRKAVNRTNIEREKLNIERISNEKSDNSNDKYTKESKGKESKEKNSKEKESVISVAPQYTLLSKYYFKLHLNERKEIFRGAVVSKAHIYDDEILQKFIKKWTEVNSTGSRMRFELGPTFNVDDRLEEYAANWQKFDSAKNTVKKGHVTANIEAGMDVANEILNELTGS